MSPFILNWFIQVVHHVTGQWTCEEGHLSTFLSSKSIATFWEQVGFAETLDNALHRVSVMYFQILVLNVSYRLLSKVLPTEEEIHRLQHPIDATSCTPLVASAHPVQVPPSPKRPKPRKRQRSDSDKENTAIFNEDEQFIIRRKKN